MKVNLEQFHRSLTASPLKACYWLTGDEPLQMKEASDALWQAAQNSGFSERCCYDPNAQFDWSYWGRDIHSQSLFSALRFIEVRLSAGKILDGGIKTLQHYLDHPNPQVLLLIRSPKLEQHAASQKIFAQVASLGMACQFWPLERERLPLWFSKRLASEGLSTSPEGLQCLVDYTEGNLLAAAQAINLLSLLHPQQVLSLEHIEQSLAKQARFDVFQLAEVFLEKDVLRYNAMLQSLKAEGVEPVLVLWALVKEIRLMLQLMEYKDSGQSLAAVWPTLGIFDKRRPRYQTALNQQRNWSGLMIKAAVCDVQIKGYGSGDPWLSFSRLI